MFFFTGSYVVMAAICVGLICKNHKLRNKIYDLRRTSRVLTDDIHHIERQWYALNRCNYPNQCAHKESVNGLL